MIIWNFFIWTKYSIRKVDIQNPNNKQSRLDFQFTVAPGFYVGYNL